MNSNQLLAMGLGLDSPWAVLSIAGQKSRLTVKHFIYTLILNVGVSLKTPCVRLVECAAALLHGRQELTMKQEKLLK